MSKLQKLLLIALLETIAEFPNGAPEGPMYMALMSKMSLEDFNNLIEILALSGLITRLSYVAKVTKKGAELIADLKSARTEAPSP